MTRRILENNDGFVKSPTSALRVILHCFKVQNVRIIAKDLRALPVLWDWWRFYTLPSEYVCLRVDKKWESKMLMREIKK
jgi:hypothetical protein